MSGKFAYNDEMFPEGEDRARAEKEFKEIWFALDSTVIRDTFLIHNQAADNLKERFQFWGFRVVLLAVVALSIAAVEPALLYPLVEAGYMPHALATVAAAVAGLAGVAAVLMGFFGMGITHRKREWLQKRLVCERIRQWRWQHFIASIPEILSIAGDDSREEGYNKKRDESFLMFVESYKSHLGRDLDGLLNPAKDDNTAFVADSHVKLDDPRIAKALDEAGAHTAVSAIILAYRAVRIGAQRRYAGESAKADGDFISHPAAQEVWSKRRSIIILMAIFVLHIGVLFGVFFVSIPHIVSKVMNVSAVVLALVALGIRAIEDGLRSSEHLGRIKGYFSEVGSIEEAFDEAQNGAERRAAMVSMEKAAFKEMVDFMRAGARSRYVM
jgi:hypothetical protein